MLCRAAIGLRELVLGEVYEHSGESFTRFMNELSKQIFELTKSLDTVERMGGIMAMDEVRHILIYVN